MTEKRRAFQVLAMNTFAFTMCFAAWMINGVLVTFLVNKGVYQWDKAQIGWLVAAPVLTGAVARLPLGMLTDKYGGRIVFTLVMLAAAVPMYLLGSADSYFQFLLISLGFGLCGASFAVGVAYTSLWFPTERQGTALGIFGMGNVGAAITAMGAPRILDLITDGGVNLEGWRLLPQLYAAVLAGTAVAFWLLTYSKRIPQERGLSLAGRLAPLRNIRVWRFGLYYFFVFGGFVALSQWLVPYYVNVYSLSVASAGMMVAMFSFPAGLIRAAGGFASDKWGPRAILSLSFGAGIVLMVVLFPPRMEVQSPGQGVMADRSGIVMTVTEREIVVGEQRFALQRPGNPKEDGARVRFGIHSEGEEEGFILFPRTTFQQQPVVKAGDNVQKGQLLARGVTSIYFQANRWIFTGLVFLLGILMGIGSAAVYKHIPNYFPKSVGAVGGLVGVIGALGGFFNPIMFGYLLDATGVWTTCWMLLALAAGACLVWMRVVIRRAERAEASAQPHWANRPGV